MEDRGQLERAHSLLPSTLWVLGIELMALKLDSKRLYPRSQSHLPVSALWPQWSRGEEELDSTGPKPILEDSELDRIKMSEIAKGITGCPSCFTPTLLLNRTPWAGLFFIFTLKTRDLNQ